MRQYKKNSIVPGNMDSLVDIVSNNLGILIILAVFMALFSVIDPADQTRQAPAKPQVLTPKRLMVPWSHPSNKNPVLFAIRRNRILHLDMARFFQELAERSHGSRPEALTIRQEGVNIRFFPVTNQVYCLEFRPHKNAGESGYEAGKAKSAWKRAAMRYPPEKFYYFFWVSGDSFELFRNLRKGLWDKQVEVGWKPTGPNEALELCNGFEGSTGFQPQ